MCKSIKSVCLHVVRIWAPACKAHAEVSIFCIYTLVTSLPGYIHANSLSQTTEYIKALVATQSASAKLTHGKHMAAFQHNNRALISRIISQPGLIDRVNALIEHLRRRAQQASLCRLRALFAADSRASMVAL